MKNIQTTTEKLLDADFWETATAESVKDTIGDEWLAVNTEDQVGFTPLIIACQHSNDANAIKELLEHGARNHHDTPWASTALHYAAGCTSNPDVIRVLLDKKYEANPNAVDNSGITPLMEAVLNENEGILEAILETRKTVPVYHWRWVNTELRGSDGNTALLQALDLAIKEDNPNPLITLVKAGANLKAENRNGYSALDTLANDINRDDLDHYSNIVIDAGIAVGSITQADVDKATVGV